MRTEMGVSLDILKILEKSPRQSPQSLKKALPHGLSSIKTALVYLKDLGHVANFAHGLYIITEQGKYVLHQQLNIRSSKKTEDKI